MTNTLSSIYTAATTGVASSVDGYLAIGVAIMVALMAFALAKQFVPQKKKVV